MQKHTRVEYIGDDGQTYDAEAEALRADELFALAKRYHGKACRDVPFDRVMEWMQDPDTGQVALAMLRCALAIPAGRAEVDHGLVDAERRVAAAYVALLRVVDAVRTAVCGNPREEPAECPRLLAALNCADDTVRSLRADWGGPKDG